MKPGNAEGSFGRLMNRSRKGIFNSVSKNNNEEKIVLVNSLKVEKIVEVGLFIPLASFFEA
jgi:hypothetical protein